MSPGCTHPSWTSHGQVSEGEVRRTQKAISRLLMLQVHDVMIILKISLSIPKLMYILRTADCFDDELLTQFDKFRFKRIIDYPEL